MKEHAPDITRRTALKAGAGGLTVAGLGGVGIMLTTQTGAAVAITTDDSITASDVTLANNEQEVTGVTLQPTFNIDYEDFSAGIDQLDFSVTISQVVANVTTDPGVNATTLVTDWHADSASGDYVAYSSGTATDGGSLVDETNHAAGTQEALASVSESVDLDATGLTQGAVAGTGETASFTGTVSLISNLTDMVVEHFPGGGTSTSIADDEAGISEVTVDYSLTLRDSDNGTTSTDTETVSYYVIIDNPSSTSDTSGSSGTGATGS